MLCLLALAVQHVWLAFLSIASQMYTSNQCQASLQKHMLTTNITQIVHHYTADSIAVSAKAPFTKQCMHALFSMCQNSWSAN